MYGHVASNQPCTPAAETMPQARAFVRICIGLKTPLVTRTPFAIGPQRRWLYVGYFGTWEVQRNRICARMKFLVIPGTASPRLRKDKCMEAGAADDVCTGCMSCKT